MGQRYQMLRKFQPVLRILAWVAGGLYALATVFGLVYNLTEGRAVIGSTTYHYGSAMLAFSSIISFWIGLLVSFVWWLALMAAAELIGVLLDTEDNTRLAATLLQEPEEESEAAT